MHLGTIPVGRTATIHSLEASSVISQRLMAFGLLPGVEVRVIAVAPLGDPITVEANGSRISLRREDASVILVNAPPSKETAP